MVSESCLLGIILFYFESFFSLQSAFHFSVAVAVQHVSGGSVCCHALSGVVAVSNFQILFASFSTLVVQSSELQLN